MLLILFSFFFPPQPSGWELLATVEIVIGYDEFMGSETEQPKFSQQLISNQGTKITLEGFVIPIQENSEQDYLILSRFPYQSCFFCGAAGPETVVEVYATEPFTFTDQRVEVTGILTLNKEDPLHLFYILKEAVVKKSTDG